MSIAVQKQLTVGAIIEYYDGPLLFTAFDKVQTCFLCAHLQFTDQGSKYVAVPISKPKLDLFFKGEIDLRSIYIFPEVNEFYLIIATSEASWLEAVLTDRNDVPDDLLPSEGYFVTEPVLNEPLAENRSLLEASLDVAEAKEDPVIDAYTYSDFLKIIQDFLKYGYKKAIAPLRTDLRKAISAERYYRAQVCATASGSFTVKLRSAATGDLNHYVELDRGIQRIVEVFEAATDSNKVLEVLRANRGHFVGTFNRLLDLLIEQNCSITIAWRPTTFGQPTQRLKITREEATTIHAALATQTDLSTEFLEFVGVANDVVTSSSIGWTLKTDDGELHRGFIEPDKDITLTGTIIGNRYKYFCKEVLRENSVGRRHTILYLYKYESA